MAAPPPLLTVYYTSSTEATLHIASTEPSPANPHHSTPCSLTYLNEGGANILFHILPIKDGPPLPSQLQNKLLRLRKNHPHLRSTRMQFDAFNTHFKPLFRAENLVDLELIRLETGLVSAINSALNTSQSRISRPANRLQDLLAETEPYGFLVTDMSINPITSYPDSDSDDVLVQLKPKWLLQSPTAPRDAKRCRTCALRARRVALRRGTERDGLEVCPLGLVSDSSEERRRAVQAVTGDEGVREVLVHDEGVGRLLGVLRREQGRSDRVGVVGYELDGVGEEGEGMVLDLCKAMTLRDCTLFLRRRGDRVEARLGDWDLKSESKMGTWRAVERSLIDEGWYANREDEGTWVRETVCVLSRETG